MHIPDGSIISAPQSVERPGDGETNTLELCQTMQADYAGTVDLVHFPAHDCFLRTVNTEDESDGGEVEVSTLPEVDGEVQTYLAVVEQLRNLGWQ